MIWSPKAMALAERERRALVTVIDGHIAVVLPHSLARTDGDQTDLAQLIARISQALAAALEDGADG